MISSERKVTLPGIAIRRKNGTMAHYGNSEYEAILDVAKG